MCACSLQFKKKPEKKIAPTTNRPPATMPTHASAWLRRLAGGVRRGRIVGRLRDSSCLRLGNLLVGIGLHDATHPGWGGVGKLATVVYAG